jgi:hypothetical protein
MISSIAMPRRTALLPVAWVLRSGWLPSEPELLELEDDGAVGRALLEGRAPLALLDPLHWARDRSAFRPVPRTAVTLGPGGSDMLLLGEVRLDGLERVTAPPLPPRTNEEAVPRALVREYLGVSEPLGVGQEGTVSGEEGRIVTGTDALTEQPYEYVESLSRMWWILSGAPWVRALPVEAASTPPGGDAESLLREIARLLDQQGETVAAGLAREHGGEEGRWLALVRALGLSYGAEERKGLSALLAQAARLRLSPRVEDASLPRY